MPRSAKVDIIIQVVVNNVRYTATKKEVVPQDDFAGVSIAEADIKEEQVPWPTVNLRVDVTAVPELDRTMAERKHLVCGRGAGEYTVRSVGFVGKWVIHSAETEPTLEISPAGSYILGDAGISSEITNINPMDLGIKPLPLTGAKTVIDIFKRGQ
ncbi:hypothetical protein MANI_119522 [Metarhizium anisopliae]|nr:hypothetical protein MANI_119522 [Metarhizium anisopliae]